MIKIDVDLDYEDTIMTISESLGCDCNECQESFLESDNKFVTTFDELDSLLKEYKGY